MNLWMMLIYGESAHTRKEYCLGLRVTVRMRVILYFAELTQPLTE